MGFFPKKAKKLQFLGNFWHFWGYFDPKKVVKIKPIFWIKTGSNCDYTAQIGWKSRHFVLVFIPGAVFLALFISES